MKNCIVLIFLFYSFSGFCQKFSESERSYLSKLERILKVDTIPFSKSEIRVYKKHEISTGLELFRIYYDEHKKDFKADFYYTVAKKTSKDSHEIVIKQFELKSFYNLEYVVLKLLNTNIQYIPTASAVSYKMKSKSEIILEMGKFYISQTSSTTVDGVSYYIQVKDDKDFNEIHYSNPERYLELYPTIDELISVNEFLDIIKKDFNIFED
ncbi:hypothetical protein [Paenimyroides aestuarii]|uniref:Uncharacterized protein n=1 Tax=Paenimyroides aestuarii TaxID=2968490 RepID=A0ABY5NV09_9FLAO|nr:hypothetical protein [Paenimyroides aestuarii]UUV22418.1 hypothetical protein NPX36_05100 [Paenimyroides aestuarii]